MKLNHANLGTSDVAGLCDVFTQHFGFSVLSMRGASSFAVMRGSDGFILNLMGARQGATVTYPKGFHVGFFVETPAEVTAKHAELEAAGRNPGPVEELERGGWPSTTFYCEVSDGILIEVSASRGGAKAATASQKP